MIDNSIVFEKKTSSVFFVQSAFQLLCAAEAIQEFAIDDTKIVFCLFPEFPLRNEQMRKMAEHMSLPFEEYDVTQIKETDFYNKEGLFASKSSKLYRRVFIGDYFCTSLFMLAYKYSETDAVLLYMDDGNSTISIFRGVHRDNRPIGWRQRLSWYKNIYKKQQKFRIDLENELLRRGLHCTSCFFTIYSDIKTRHFSIYPNSFRNIALKYTANQHSDKIYVIGNAVNAFVEQYRITVPIFESILWRKLCELKELYPNQQIVFIPHGRDENIHIPAFCSILDIDYRRLDETIEFFLLQKGEIPKVVYGINSTALFTIKRMFPYARVINWFIHKKEDNSYYKFYESVSRYFSRNGIETDVIKYPNPSIIEQLMTFGDNIYGILKLFLSKCIRHSME